MLRLFSPRPMNRHCRKICYGPEYGTIEDVLKFLLKEKAVEGGADGPTLELKPILRQSVEGDSDETFDTVCAS